MKRDSLFQSLIFFIFLILVLNQKFWGDQLHDHFSFWSASKSFLANLNPYNLELNVEHVKTCCNELIFPDTIERVWGLPVIFVLISWFGLFSFSNYLFYHSIISAFLISVSFFVIAKLYKLNKNFIFTTLILLTFLPAYEALIVGPAIMYVLIGISLYLYFVNQNKSLTNTFIGGIFLSLTIIKPHFLFLIPILILALSFIRKEFKTLLGMLFGGVLLTFFMYILSPNLVNYYLKIVSEFPVNLYKTPTIISYLQNHFQFKAIYRFFPALLIGLISFILLLKNKNKLLDSKNDQLLFSYALILSAIFAPYLWVYDYLPLLISLVFILSKLKKSVSLLILLFGNLLLWVIAIPMHYSIWYPYLLFYFLIKLDYPKKVTK